MNDWLTYEASGSSRAVISHAAYHPNTKPIAQAAANSVRSREYDMLNSELDRYYAKAQEMIALKKKLNAECVNFVNTGRRLRADYIIGKTKSSKLYESGDALYRKITNFDESSLQKAALVNKYDSISNKIANQVISLSRLPEGAFSIDTLNSLIDEINSNMTPRR